MTAVFLLTAAILAICVIGLGVNILFFKKDFPKFDVGTNEEMQKRGIRCFKDVDADLQGRQICSGGEGSAECKDCKLYEHSSDSRKA